MHAYIISGNDFDAVEQKVQDFLQEWHVSPFDIVHIETEEEKKEISIQQIRAMTKQVSLTPTHGAYLVTIIKEAHRMTIAAQNALLKLLEEPPAKVKILLLTSTPDALLETILSRCQKCTISEKKNTDNPPAISLESLFQFQKQTISQMLAGIDTYTNTSAEARDFVDGALQTLHTALRSGSCAPYRDEACIHLAKILLKTRMHLSANVNQKLALDTAFLEARQGQ